MHVDWELVKKAAEAHENDTEAAEALLLQALGIDSPEDARAVLMAVSASGLCNSGCNGHCGGCNGG